MVSEIETLLRFQNKKCLRFQKMIVIQNVLGETFLNLQIAFEHISGNRGPMWGPCGSLWAFRGPWWAHVGPFGRFGPHYWPSLGRPFSGPLLDHDWGLLVPMSGPMVGLCGSLWPLWGPIYVDLFRYMYIYVLYLFVKLYICIYIYTHICIYTYTKKDIL